MSSAPNALNQSRISNWIAGAAVVFSTIALIKIAHSVASLKTPAQLESTSTSWESIRGHHQHSTMWEMTDNNLTLSVARHARGVIAMQSAFPKLGENMPDQSQEQVKKE